VLNFSSPVFVVLLSWVLLKERVPRGCCPWSWSRSAGRAPGVADFSRFGPEIGVGLASAILAALAYVTIRRLSRTESPGTIVLYFSLYSSVFSGIAIAVASTAGWSRRAWPRGAGTVEPCRAGAALRGGRLRDIGRSC